MHNTKKPQLTSYEKQILNDLENDEFVPVPNEKKEIARYKKYFAVAAKKNKRINIRVAPQDLQAIREKAMQSGIPYQTLVAAILHQYATNKSSLGL